MGRTYRCRVKRKRTCTYSDDLLQFRDLCMWMRSKRFMMKKMKPAIFEDTGRGLKAYEKIKAGDLIISVPLSKLITCETVMNSYLKEILLKYCRSLSAVEILSIFLMCEKMQSADSEWSPYIYCLPSEYIMPAHFPEECLEFLPSVIQNEVKEQTCTLEMIYCNLKPALNSIERTLPQFHELLTYELFKWAWASVNTRCVYMECEKFDCDNLSCKSNLALAPVLDFFNHSPNVQVTAGFNKETNCYEIVHHNNILKYEQVFINYGPHSNHKLFLEYGFVVPDNLHDQVQFKWDDLLEAVTLLDKTKGYTFIKEKMLFMNQFDLLRNIGCESGGPTWNFDILLKLLSCKKYKREELQIVLSDGDSLDAEEYVIYRRLLCHLLNLKINDFSVSFDDDNLKGLPQFSLNCIKITKQLCSEYQKILLKCLSVVV